jgi:uncharacterized protein (DUF697 family)
MKPAVSFRPKRHTTANAIIERYQWINAAVVAATPLPGIDLLATAAINAQMVVELGRAYQVDLSIEEGKELAYALARTLTGLGIVKGVMNLLAIGMQTTLPTAIASRGVQGCECRLPHSDCGQKFYGLLQPEPRLGRRRHWRCRAKSNFNSTDENSLFGNLWPMRSLTCGRKPQSRSNYP